MDKHGNIKEFDNHAAAKKEGYDFELSREQADNLNRLKKVDRLPEYIWVNFLQEVLNGKEPDFMMAQRYKNAIKYTCEIFLEETE